MPKKVVSSEYLYHKTNLILKSFYSFKILCYNWLIGGFMERTEFNIARKIMGVSTPSGFLKKSYGKENFYIFNNMIIYYQEPIESEHESNGYAVCFGNLPLSTAYRITQKYSEKYYYKRVDNLPRESSSSPKENTPDENTEFANLSKDKYNKYYKVYSLNGLLAILTEISLHAQNASDEEIESSLNHSIAEATEQLIGSLQLRLPFDQLVDKLNDASNEYYHKRKKERKDPDRVLLRETITSFDEAANPISTGLKSGVKLAELIKHFNIGGIIHPDDNSSATPKVTAKIEDKDDRFKTTITYNKLWATLETNVVCKEGFYVVSHNYAFPIKEGGKTGEVLSIYYNTFDEENLIGNDPVQITYDITHNLISIDGRWATPSSTEIVAIDDRLRQVVSQLSACSLDKIQEQGKTINFKPQSDKQ